MVICRFSGASELPPRPHRDSWCRRPLHRGGEPATPPPASHPTPTAGSRGSRRRACGLPNDACDARQASHSLRDTRDDGRAQQRGLRSLRRSRRLWSARQPPPGAARGHRSNETPRIETDRLHANAIAEQCATREGTGGIDCDHRDFESAGAIDADELLGECALSRAWWPRYADAMRLSLPDPAMHVRQDALKTLALILDEADGASEGGGVAARQTFEHRLHAHIL